MKTVMVENFVCDRCDQIYTTEFEAEKCEINHDNTKCKHKKIEYESRYVEEQNMPHDSLRIAKICKYCSAFIGDVEFNFGNEEVLRKIFEVLD